ncbi:MAG: tetratricopeptide repeat protein [Acidobacteria bacterium]|nr:tetratricopeptide repeat protein [Acidobacteriota bacterium]
MLRFLPGRQARHTEPAVDRLDGWKEIAAYLRRDVRTVQRWEKEEDLPIQRHLHSRLGTVYAYKPELDAWWNNRGTDLEQNRPMDRFPFWEKNKKTTIGITMGVVLALLAGLLMWMDIGSSSNPEGLSFQERDWVLIADFENRTGESVFDGVLEYALEREISNSQFVNVVPRERIEDTLRLMRKPLDTPIDRALGREICLRDGGIKALLTGRVEKLDSTYLLSVQVVDPSQGQAIATASAEAVGQKQVLSALKELSNWVRQNLGEKLALIQESERKLEKAATPSLRAVQLFTEARTLFDRGRGGHGPAEQLLRQTLEIDSEFASASIWLAWTLLNQREPFDEYINHAEEAFQLAATTSEQERYFIHGSYYWMKDEPDQAIHAFEALLGLYPDHFWATHKLATLYKETGQEKLALTYRLRLADLRPTHLRFQFAAATSLIQVDGDLMRARPYFDRARNLLTPEVIREGEAPVLNILFSPALEAWLSGDPQTVLVEIDGALQTVERLGIPNPRLTLLGSLYAGLGQRQRARRWITSGLDKADRWYHWLLAAMAHNQGDLEAMTSHLRQFLQSGNDSGSSTLFRRITSGPRMAIFLAESGFLTESETLLTQLERPPSSDPLTQLARGVLELRKGNTRESIQFIENTLKEGSNPYLSSLFLSEAWSQEGELQKAVQVLKEASEKKYLVLVPSTNSPIRWLRVRSALAKLYRETGHNEEARAIEEELRKHLAYADPDHPILRQLDRTKELASLDSER